MSGVLKDGFWRARERRESLEDEVSRLRTEDRQLRAQLAAANERAERAERERDSLRKACELLVKWDDDAPLGLVESDDMIDDAISLARAALAASAEPREGSGA